MVGNPEIDAVAPDWPRHTTGTANGLCSIFGDSGVSDHHIFRVVTFSALL